MENAMTSLNNRADFDRCLHHIDSALFSAMFIAHQEAGVARIIDRDGIERIVDKMEEMHLNSELTVVELSRDMLRSYVQRNHLTLEVALGR
jgi:hypothetical protein